MKGENTEGQETETESEPVTVSLSQSHKSLPSALIVATRQRAATHNTLLWKKHREGGRYEAATPALDAFKCINVGVPPVEVHALLFTALACGGWIR